MYPRLIVFDFDGVIADSEVLANTVLAEFVTELGVPTTLDDSLRTFMGKRLADVRASIAAMTGRPLADDAADEFMRRTLARFRTDLKEIPGVREYLASTGGVARCIASSSSPDRLAACLEVLGLAEAFGQHVYSASMVPRGKPHPDLFLYAAAQLGVAPDEAIVIEDSEGGVRAGVAAGMTTIAFLGASHIRDGDEARLRRAGAHHVARTFDDIERITRRLARHA
jgi:HAD superfamily hydrolase (TIGR01509 family)